MNQQLAEAADPRLFTESATGEPIPQTETVRFVRSVVVPKEPVRFRVLSYELETRQVYDGDERGKAQEAWSNVEHGIFLGVDEDHAWAAIERR